MYKETVSQSHGAVYEDASQISPDPSTSENGELPQNVSETFLRNICLFYLRLQGQLLLPASTIQTVVEEMQNLLELGQDYTSSKLHSLLKDDMSLTDDDVTKICDCVRDSDLFSAFHQGPLRTIYSRAQTFKNMFKYIKPPPKKLGIIIGLISAMITFNPNLQHLGLKAPYPGLAKFLSSPQSERMLFILL